MQRGGADVSHQASRDCVHPKESCGGIPAETPVRVFEENTVADILLQQNLNHYNPGWPGFIDVAIGPYPAPATDNSTDWTILRQIPDWWAHMQANWQNFSIPVVLGDYCTGRCVIRVRYHPNKPTEPVFHNCADVTVTPSKNRLLAEPLVEELPRYRTVRGPKVSQGLFGFATPRPEFGTRPSEDLVSMLPTGQVVSMGKNVPGGYTLPDATPVVRTVKGETKLGFFLERETLFNPLTEMVLYDPSGSTGSTAEQITFTGTNFNKMVAVSSNDDDQYPFVVLERADLTDGNSNYTFQLRRAGPTGAMTAPLASCGNMDVFVNFLWMTNVVNNRVYALVGDENSLSELRAKIVTFDLSAGTCAVVMVDVSAYTLGYVYAHPSDGTLYSVSPGLVADAEPTYTLVKLNPATGSITAVAAVGGKGQFQRYYGGGIYGNVFSNPAVLPCLFQHSTKKAMVYAEVDLATGDIRTAPTVYLGVNQQLALRNVVML